MNIVVNKEGINEVNEYIRESYVKGKKSSCSEFVKDLTECLNKVLGSNDLFVSYEKGHPEIVVK